MAIQTVGVIGAKGIGADVARACLAAGFAVTLVDPDRAILQGLKDDLGARLEAAVAQGTLTAADKAATLKRFACSTQVADFHGDDFVIATGCDQSEATARTLRATEAAMGSYAIIASDAPAPAVTGLTRPDKLIGLRLDNAASPELVRYPQTSDETYHLVAGFVRALRQGQPS